MRKFKLPPAGQSRPPPRPPVKTWELLFGEMSIILLKGLKASNEKIKSTGFEFLYTDLKAALKTVV